MLVVPPPNDDHSWEVRTADRAPDHQACGLRRTGIPFYWRIEAEPRLFCHRLDPATSTYALDLELAPGKKVDLTEPWSLTVDMGELESLAVHLVRTVATLRPRLSR